jgi:hypothetical protein
LSILYRKRDGITLAQLVRGWASELPGDPKQVEDELLRFLLEDAASGRLDKAGPLVGNDPAGCRYGLR